MLGLGNYHNIFDQIALYKYCDIIVEIILVL